MTSLPARSIGRRPLALTVAALLGLTAVVVVRSPAVARADSLTTEQRLTCPIVGELTVPITAVDTPEPAVAGGSVALDVRTPAPLPPDLDVTIESLSLELPLPPQLASVDDVTFTGGNMTGSFTTTADTVSIVLTGPVEAKSIDAPTAQLRATIAEGTAGETITWAGPTSVTSVVAGLGAQTCTGAQGNPPLQTTEIAGSPPSTATSTTTTRATTTTTEEPVPSTTTPSTTTTSRATTTTTEEPVPSTTTPSTTTTTRATTTTTEEPAPSTTTTTRATTTTTEEPAPSTTTTSRATTTTTEEPVPSTTTTTRATTTTSPSPEPPPVLRRFLLFLLGLVCVLFGLC